MTRLYADSISKRYNSRARNQARQEHDWDSLNIALRREGSFDHIFTIGTTVLVSLYQQAFYAYLTAYAKADETPPEGYSTSLSKNFVWLDGQDWKLHLLIKSTYLVATPQPVMKRLLAHETGASRMKVPADDLFVKHGAAKCDGSRRLQSKQLCSGVGSRVNCQLLIRWTTTHSAATLSRNVPSAPPALSPYPLRHKATPQSRSYIQTSPANVVTDLCARCLALPTTNFFICGLCDADSILFFNSISVALERASSLNEFAHAELSKRQPDPGSGAIFRHQSGTLALEITGTTIVSLQRKKGWMKIPRLQCAVRIRESKNRTSGSFGSPHNEDQQQSTQAN